MSRKRSETWGAPGETWGTPPSTMPAMKKRRTALDDSSRLAREAKALVALAFRNGPIEDVHAGKMCPKCHGKVEYSHITDAEMRQIMKSAVDHVYTFLVLKERDSGAYEALLSLGEQYTRAWDEPVLTRELWNGGWSKSRVSNAHVSQRQRDPSAGSGQAMGHPICC